MIRQKSVCYGCTKRALGCHDTCSDYQKEKAENEEINRKIHNDKLTSRIIIDGEMRRNKSASLHKPGSKQRGHK